MLSRKERRATRKQSRVSRSRLSWRSYYATVLKAGRFGDSQLWHLVSSSAQPGWHRQIRSPDSKPHDTRFLAHAKTQAALVALARLHSPEYTSPQPIIIDAPLPGNGCAPCLESVLRTNRRGHRLRERNKMTQFLVCQGSFYRHCGSQAHQGSGKASFRGTSSSSTPYRIYPAFVRVQANTICNVEWGRAPQLAQPFTAPPQGCISAVAI